MQQEAIKKLTWALRQHFGSPLCNQQIVNIVAYGSAVMPQTKNIDQFKNNTIDLIVEVRSAEQFHAKHLRSKPNDYAGFGYIFGSKYQSWINQNVFPMHSNHVVIEGRQLKYSVVQKKHFRKDLEEWNLLSLAGRTHKPVVPIFEYQEGMEQAISNNRKMALCLALLMSPQSKPLKVINLYLTICQLSYLGDIRFTLKMQNNNKVLNIVSNNYDQFHSIYSPILTQIQNRISNSISITSSGEMRIQASHQLISSLANESILPKTIYHELKDQYGYDNKNSLSTKILLSGAQNLSKNISDIIRLVNRASSVKMAVENLLTASPINNIKYLLKKIGKKYN